MSCWENAKTRATNRLDRVKRSNALLLLVGIIVTSAWYASAYLRDGEEFKVYHGCVWILFENIIFMWVTLVLGPVLQERLLNNKSEFVSVKRAVQGSWNTTGVISALIVTLAAATWVEEMPFEEDKYDLRNQWFGLMAANACVWSVLATLFPVSCLIFTDNLSEVAFASFIREFRGTLGYPLLYLAHAVISTVVALGIRAEVMYGLAHSGLNLLQFIGFLATFARLIYDLLQFKNTVDCASKKRESKTYFGCDVKWEEWSKKEVEEFIRDKSQYPELAPMFEEQGITGKMLQYLYDTNLQDMKEINVAQRMNLKETIKRRILSTDPDLCDPKDDKDEKHEKDDKEEG